MAVEFAATRKVKNLFTCKIMSFHLSKSEMEMSKNPNLTNQNYKKPDTMRKSDQSGTGEDIVKFNIF